MQNSYLLQPIKITNIEELTNDTRLFTFNFSFAKFIPGQFLMLSIPGFGEAPFGIMAPNYTDGRLQLLIRKVGALTSKIFELRKGNTMFVRGPLGNGFPLGELKNKNIMMFAGGTGIVPLKAMIDYIRSHQKNFDKIQFFYGAKNPENIFFQKELGSYRKFAEILLTVEAPSNNWEENIGLVTSLISKKTVIADNSAALLCGPPVMYKRVAEKLQKLGFENKKIYLLFERRIRCGIGKCQHCTCGNKYVCLDGPVFRYDETLKFPEGI